MSSVQLKHIAVIFFLCSALFEIFPLTCILFYDMVLLMCDRIYTFLITNFCCVLYVVCFLLGNSQATEFYMPMFRNTLSVPSS